MIVLLFAVGFLVGLVGIPLLDNGYPFGAGWCAGMGMTLIAIAIVAEPIQYDRRRRHG